MKTFPLFDLLYTIVVNLVDTPEDVNITVEEDDERVVFLVRTKDGEQGQVIGVKGTLGESIRAILRPSARRHRMKRVYMEVITDENLPRKYPVSPPSTQT